MLKFKTAGAVIALSLFAASCQTSGGALKNSAAYAPVSIDTPTLDAHLADLRTQDFKFKSDDETVNVDALLEAFPDLVSLSYDTVDVASNGATVISNLKIAPAMMPTLGFSIGELSLWGLDDDFAIARLNGQRLEETAPLARRIEAESIELYGLDAVLTPLLGMAAMSGEEELENLKFEGYNLSIEKMVYDDVVLRPFNMDAKTPEALDELAEYFPIVQQIAAVNNTLAADTAASYGVSGSLSVLVDDRSNFIKFGMENAGSKGLRGGDVDHGVMNNMTYEFAMPSFETEETGPLSMKGSLEKSVQSGVRLAKVMDYLAKGVLPPRTDTDLLSFGVMESYNERVSMGGTEIYSVESSKVDLSNFHWLIPNKVSMEAENAVYDIGGFIAALSTSYDMAFDEEELAMVQGAMDALAKQGLDKPSMDVRFGWDWNAEEGDTNLGMAFGIDDYMRFDISTDGLLPNFQSISNLIADDYSSVDQDALQGLFAFSSLFEGLEVNLKDEGGLDKSFALAIDMAALAPEDDPSAAMLRNATPESLRQMASSMLFMGGAAVASEIPQAQDYIQSVANFINEGGALKLTVKPNEPLGMMGFAALEQMDPPELIDALGVSLTHAGAE